MTTSVLDRTVMPPRDALVDLVGRVSSTQSAELVGPDGTRIMLPARIHEVLRQVVLAMSHGQAVTVVPHNQRLTTLEAADLLGCRDRPWSRCSTKAPFPLTSLAGTAACCSGMCSTTNSDAEPNNKPPWKTATTPRA